MKSKNTPENVSLIRILFNNRIVIGIFGSGSTALIMIIAGLLNYKIFNPNLFFALVLVWAAYQGGIVAGLLSAAIAIFYTLIDWSVSGHLFTYSYENLQKLIVVIIAMPSMATIVGLLKGRSDRQQKSLEYLLNIEKERNHLLSEALSQKEFPDDVLPLCAWCRKAKEDDSWVNLDSYLNRRYGIPISHTICPDCATGLHLQVDKRFSNDNKGA